MLTYVTEAWTLCKQDEMRMTEAEVEFMRKTSNSTRLNYKKNFDIIKELDKELTALTGGTMFF
jgi:hypothetical protein